VSDWHKAAGNSEAGSGSLRDPGVMLARDIQAYYRIKGFSTKVNKHEIGGWRTGTHE
jgi:hypothetical protein